MFTKVQDIEAWIRDNNLTHWIFSKNDRTRRQSDAPAPNDKVVDSDYYGDNMEDKIALTMRVLDKYDDGILYGIGFFGKKATDGLCCEYCKENERVQRNVGTMPLQPAVDEAAVEKRLRRMIEAEFQQKEYEANVKKLRDDREELDRERKEFEKEKAGVFGIAVEYCRPLLAAFQKRRMVGQLDSSAPVEAEPIQPIHAKEEKQEEDVFTDEEAEKIYALLARFKKVEPEYLRLIERVVEMAEGGDSMYGMAKGMLLK